MLSLYYAGTTRKIRENKTGHYESNGSSLILRVKKVKLIKLIKKYKILIFGAIQSELKV